MAKKNRERYREKDRLREYYWIFVIVIANYHRPTLNRTDMIFHVMIVFLFFDANADSVL